MGKSDKDSVVHTNQFPLLDYYVYDVIDEKKKYNVYRLENMQTNPYIRFKIVGGDHQGLNIRFSTVKANYKIHDHKIMTDFTP